MGAGRWSELWLDAIDSTSDFLRRDPQPPGTVVVARRQTRGRGRRGQRWESTEGESLTFSLAMPPQPAGDIGSILGLAAGLGVAEGLEGMGYAPAIKWPNDLLIDSRKVAGILVEVVNGRPILGVGLNLNQSRFDPGLGAISLRQADGRSWTPEAVLPRLMPRILDRCEDARHRRGQVLDEIGRRCALGGRRIGLVSGGRHWIGIARGLGPEGALRVEIDGVVRDFHQASEVRRLQDD
jgi:BirA family biotin operon repressor/biotin-[acetyl-CoA-carboxylase] ligase